MQKVFQIPLANCLIRMKLMPHRLSVDHHFVFIAAYAGLHWSKAYLQTIGCTTEHAIA